MLIVTHAECNLKQRGFSLIELMVTLSVLGVILAIAIPSFQAMIKNSNIRNAAESVSNGLSKARAEAVGRNMQVDFVLSSDSAWVVRQASDSAVIESKPGREGSPDVTVSAVDASNNPATTVSFTALGGTAAGSFPIDHVDFSTTGGNISLRVLVGLGGKVKMCDPNLDAGSSPRAC
ncbi:MAG: GspH/FimT family pseudopilin [Methylophilaceae bacterium]